MGGLFGVPIFGYFMATFALSPALAVIGGVADSDTVTRWSTYFAADHKTVVFITTLVIVALVSVLSYLGTRLVLKVCTLLVLIAAAGFFIDLLILLFTSHDALRPPRRRRRGPGRLRRRPWTPGDPGAVSRARAATRRRTRSARSTTRSRSRSTSTGARTCRPSSRAAAGESASSPRCGRAGIGNARDPADRDRDLHAHGRLRLLRLGVQRQLRGAGRQRDRQRGLRVLLQPRREQQPAGDAAQPGVPGLVPARRASRRRRWCSAR